MVTGPETQAGGPRSTAEPRENCMFQHILDDYYGRGVKEVGGKVEICSFCFLFLSFSIGEGLRGLTKLGACRGIDANVTFAVIL